MPNLSNTVTFLFAGDGSLASDGLCAFLQTKSNFLLLSECRDGATAIADIETHKPEIAIIDSQLPDMHARQIIEAVRAHNRATKIVVLGAAPDRNLADELLSMGADAYVVRSGPSRHLTDAIRYARDGGKYLAPQLSSYSPVALNGHSNGLHEEAHSSLSAAVEAQALTMQRLENAMSRAQSAVELLQQKVEHLTGAPQDLQQATSFVRKLPNVKTSMTAVAATLVFTLFALQFSGVLRPVHAGELTHSPVGAVDPAKATVEVSLSGWEWENVENARSLLANQQYVPAEKLCRLVLKRNPSNTLASKLLASALFHQNRVSESADVVKTLAVP